MGGVIAGRPLVRGEAEAELLVSAEPLSFWGGYDQASGEIIDRRHPLSGRNAAGTILALPSSRGSSTTAAVLLEAVRRGTAPAAILTDGVDRFLTLAAIVSDELFDVVVPIVAVTAAELAALPDGRRARVHADGKIELVERRAGAPEPT